MQRLHLWGLQRYDLVKNHIFICPLGFMLPRSFAAISTFFGSAAASGHPERFVRSRHTSFLLYGNCDYKQEAAPTGHPLLLMVQIHDSLILSTVADCGRLSGCHHLSALKK